MFNPIHVPAQADSSKSASFSGGPAIPEGSALASALTKAGAVALTLLIAASCSAAFSQSEKTRFEDFGAFLQRTRTAHRSDLLSSSGAKVRDTAAFEEMRKAILDRYEGIHVTHSFLLGEQQYDCVPIDEQPAVRNFHLSGIASPPPAERAARPDPVEGPIRQASIAPERPFDEAGNSTQCEAHTVPLLRNTLETMSRFATLADFYSKLSGDVPRDAESKARPAKFTNPSISSHSYSYTFQSVNNLGGNSNNNIWDPYVDTSEGEVFSLTQAWYVGGSGTGLQTEEVGWVVYPAMFNDEKSHFFIYSTPDDYSSTDTKYNCWDNTCGDFVQVADSGFLGSAFSSVSTTGGTQYELAAEYYLFEGNWWLSIAGTWIGYYPGAMYNGGQNTKNAQFIEFGTETVGTQLEQGADIYYPSAGSGEEVGTPGTMAYQRNLWYIATGGSFSTYWDNLTPEEPSPSCYLIDGPSSENSSGWQVYFLDGGPGGFGTPGDLNCGG